MAAAAVVQSKWARTASPTTTLSATLNNVAAGSWVIALVMQQTGGNDLSMVASYVDDSNSNLFTKDRVRSLVFGAFSRRYASSGNVTVRWHGQNSGYCDMCVYEVSGLPATGAFDCGDAFWTNSSSLTSIPCKLTTRSAGVILGMQAEGYGATITHAVSSPYAISDSGNAHEDDGANYFTGCAFHRATTAPVTNETVTVTLGATPSAETLMLVVAYGERDLSNSSRRRGTVENVYTLGSSTGKDYTALGTWEADTDINLTVYQGEHSEVLECEKGSYAVGVQILGATTSSAYFRTIRAASTARHLGVPGAGVKFTQTADWFTLTLVEDYVKIHDIEAVTTYASATISQGIRIETCTAPHVVGCLVTGTNSGSAEGKGLASTYGDTSCVIVNCIAHSSDDAGLHVRGGQVLGCSAVSNGTGGIAGNTTDPRWIGNLATGNTTDWTMVTSGATGTSHNLSSDATAPATGTYYRSKTLYYRDASIDWYWLAAHANAAIHRGTNLSADATFAFDDDIAFNVRGHLWSIGAHDWQSESSRRRGIQEEIKTFGTSGNGRDYTALGTWEGDTDIDLVSAAKSAVLECYRDATSYDVSGGMSLYGGTTSSVFFRVVRAASGARHLGVPGAGVKFTVSTGYDGVVLSDDYSALEDVEVEVAVSNSDYVWAVQFRGTGGTGIRLVGCLVAATNTGFGDGNGVYFYSTGTRFAVVNCIARDCDYYGFSGGGDTTHALYGCTQFGAGLRGVTNDSEVLLKGNISCGSASADYYGSASSSSTANLSDDATAPAFGTYYRNKTLTFENAGANIYRLAAGDWDARGKGTNLSRDSVFPFNDDITGRLRFQWDLGAAEFCVSSRRRGVNEQVSTFGTSGAGRDYTEVSTWEADTDNDLVENAESEVLECYADAASYAISPTDIWQSTTSMSYFRVVRAASGARHLGVPGAGVHFTGTGAITLDIDEGHAAIEDIQITASGNSSGNIYGLYLYPSRIYRVVGVLSKATNSSDGAALGFYQGAPADIAVWVNSIAYECDDQGLMISGTPIIYSCSTVYNGGWGHYWSSAGCVLKNVIGYGNTLSDFDAGVDGCTHNLSEDNTAPAFGTYYRNKTLTFKNVGADIYRLVAADTDAIGKGIDLSGDSIFPFEDDIAWARRGPDWDIGAFEFTLPTNIEGDQSWGRLEVHDGHPCTSPVVEMGNANSKTLTAWVDKYETGGGGTGVVEVWVRGSATWFLRHDVSPTWEEYTAPITRSWRYVQWKLIYVSG